MPITASITKRKRRRRLTSGAVVTQVRFVVNFREPRSGRRKQFFFARYKDAIAQRDKLLTSVATATSLRANSDLTVAKAVEYWLENRRAEVKKSTWEDYCHATGYIIGPLLVGTRWQRKAFTENGKKPEGAQFIEMLGRSRIADLTTAHIRSWHKTLTVQVSSHTANVAKKFLRGALALTAEDFHLRVPPMPHNLGRCRSKPKRAILTPGQVGCLLKAAEQDKMKGLYYAFPFLTGVRPSEQLALLWQDVDLTDGIVHIRRMQERDGSISEITKTAASAREIPMCPLLKIMLLTWRQSCPLFNGELIRVFPGLGRLSPGTGSRQYGGGPLSYTTFRNTYWRPIFKALGLPYVTPHSARHTFISTLQASGIEVGLVAKLAGHANATVTLSHYTQAVRGGEAAIRVLEKAYASIR